MQPKTLAVKLSSKGERIVRSGHPWIFSDSIKKINHEGESGDVAVIFSESKNKPIGVGLYDPHSPIRIKMLHHGSGARINDSFFAEKVERAIALRMDFQNMNTNSYRLLFGENDGFPGFIADLYRDVLVVKLYSAIWFPYLDLIVDALMNNCECKAVVLRLSRNLQNMKQDVYHEGQILRGELENEVVEFQEHGVRFVANVIKGHKTGYFLDHRHNRKRVGELSKGKSVLDVFAYAGGFSVHALVGGAKEVTSVDISKQALELAVTNAKLNTFSGKHHIVDGDAFTILKQLISESRRFDLVVIDPPSFAKSKKEIDVAKKKYSELAQMGILLTKRNGVLVLASCSSRILAEEFFEITQDAMSKSGIKTRLIETTQHDIDHPVTFPEGSYLKTAYYKVI